MISKKHKKVPTILNFIEHFFVLPSAVTRCISISAFASLILIPIGITSFALGLKMCAITVAIKKYMSIIKKKKNKYDEIVFLAKTNLDNISSLSKRLNESYVSHFEFVINNVLKEYNEMKEEIKNLKTQTANQRF